MTVSPLLCSRLLLNRASPVKQLSHRVITKTSEGTTSPLVPSSQPLTLPVEDPGLIHQTRVSPTSARRCCDRWSSRRQEGRDALPLWTDLFTFGCTVTPVLSAPQVSVDISGPIAVAKHIKGYRGVSLLHFLHEFYCT